MKLKVLLDDCVVINHCLGKLDHSPYTESNLKFFDYLASHPLPSIGIMTFRTRYNVKKQLIEKLRYRGGYAKNRCMQKFDEMRNFVSPVGVPLEEFYENLSDVKTFFRNFIDKNSSKNNNVDLRMVSNRFKGTIKEVCLNNAEKTLLSGPEREDKELLAGAICLTKEYKPLFLASTDEHFTGNLISGEIGKTYGILTGLPQKILPEIKKYEQSLLK